MMKPGKPLYGDPCNGCGQCCLAEQCPISLTLFGNVGICPALVDAGDRWNCGLIAKPELFFPHIPEDMGKMSKVLLCGISEGHCDSVSFDSDSDQAREIELGPALRQKTEAERSAIDAMMDEVLAKLRVIRQLEGEKS